jgi:aldehyde:ferredoxin oxidoreductase
MHGSWGRVLHIDLSSGRSAYVELSASRVRQYLGGIGLGTSLLYEWSAAGVDALSPGNPLVFASAPLVGSGLTTTAKFAVVTKSPLTGFIADSLSSSRFAIELKRLGIDAAIVTGRAASLVYIFIDGETIEIRDAARLKGTSPASTESFIRADVKCPDAWVAAVGAAGERGVRFATISNEGRHAGRGGVGAVMGSKNLKAIAIRGNAETPIAHPGELRRVAESLRHRSLGPLTEKYRSLGTVANLSVFNRLGTLPTRNFQQATFEGAEGLTGEALTESRFSRRHGCASCTVGCERLFRAAHGSPASQRNGADAGEGFEQRLEYETLFALGPLCGINDPDCVLEAARLCDFYGLDTISTGGTIAWAIESADRGLLPGAQAIGLRFGDGSGLLSAIRAIAERRNVGDLLAEGSRRAAEEIGCGSDEWAMHVKGLELPGYDPRSLKTMALGLAVSPRGACHNRSGAYEADFSGAVDRFRGDAGRGPLVAASEDFAAVLDSLIVCKFLRKCFSDFYVEAAEILTLVTGEPFTAGELRAVGERVHTLKKVFNIREQWRPQDDWLPRRLLAQPLATGVGAGVRLTEDELRTMIRGYYEARQWDAAGFIPSSKLASLGIPAGAPDVRSDRPS